MFELPAKELVEESSAPKKIERIKFGLFSVRIVFLFVAATINQDHHILNLGNRNDKSF